MIFEPELKQEICDPEFLQELQSSDSDSYLLDLFERSDAPDLLDAILDVDVTAYLADCLLVKVDIATMAHGLEGRSPMLDHDFMEFAASLPSHMKLRGQTTKFIFKEAVRDLLPPDVIDRPKHGFGVPLEAWFRDELRDFTRDLLMDGRLAQRGYFRPAMIERLLNEHERGTAAWHNQLWTLLMLESWHRMFIDARPQDVPVSSGALAMGA